MAGLPGCPLFPSHRSTSSGIVTQCLKKTLLTQGQLARDYSGSLLEILLLIYVYISLTNISRILCTWYIYLSKRPSILWQNFLPPRLKVLNKMKYNKGSTTELTWQNSNNFWTTNLKIKRSFRFKWNWCLKLRWRGTSIVFLLPETYINLNCLTSV